jgi:hypothetical protein
VTFTLVSTRPITGVATLAGNTLTITGAGTVTLRADQLGDSTRKPAPSVTRTLTVRKAPLTVRSDDQQKVLGQPVPTPLTLAYSGFVNGDTVDDLAPTRPTARTSATATSAEGLYPITASGGLDANYAFAFTPGQLAVLGLTGTYEALLLDADQLPVGFVTLTVPKSSFGYTGTLTLVGETKVIPLSSTARPANSTTPHGPLVPDATTVDEFSSATGLWRRTTAGVAALDLTLTVDLEGNFTGALERNGEPFATLAHGRRLAVLKTGALGAGAYTLTLAPPAEHPANEAPTRPLPEGAGHATADISTAGLLTFTGKLPDGTALTGSARRDIANAYRVFLRPHGARLGNVLAGRLPLAQSPLGTTFRRVASAELVWNKPALPAPATADKTYREGFGPVVTAANLEAWQRPRAATSALPAITLAHRLGLLAPAAASADTTLALDFLGGGLTPTQLATLPTTRTLLVNNTLAPVAATANASGFTLAFGSATTARGGFSGSFKIVRPPATAPVTVNFTGVLRQPTEDDPASALVGRGQFQVPGIGTAAPATTGEFRLEAP